MFFFHPNILVDTHLFDGVNNHVTQSRYFLWDILIGINMLSGSETVLFNLNNKHYLTKLYMWCGIHLA